MEKDFTEWLREQDCVWYLLSQEQEDAYFTKQYDECIKGKEKDDDRVMV